MNLMELMSLKGMAEKLTLSDGVEQFEPILAKLGINDVSLVKHVLEAARVASQNPTETVADFVSNGGLGRLLAGQKGADVENEHVISCVHCGELIVLT